MILIRILLLSILILISQTVGSNHTAASDNSSDKTVACEKTDLIAIGDSQTGATWSQSYFGNFLQKCLKENSAKIGAFVIYGRGGTVPASWMGKGNMDKIETIQRDLENNHKNIGSGSAVPECKKRITPMLESHTPKKILIFFGDNLLTNTREEVLNQFKNMMDEIAALKYKPADCFFLTPTYEMEVSVKRNVPSKNLENTLRVTGWIKEAVGDRCQVLSGIEIMKESAYLLDTNLLKRVPIKGLVGCEGAAKNDNIHLCGEAAADFANRVCKIIN